MITNIREKKAMNKPEKPRNLSRHQYGTLKFISENRVTLSYLRHAHANTLGSVAYHKWIAVQGLGEDAVVELTKAGKAELESYARATINERGAEGDLTDRCQRLLKLARSRVLPITKSA